MAGKYGIMVRHEDFVNRMVRAHPFHYKEDDINAWVASFPNEDLMRIDFIDVARSKVAELNDKFGKKGYRFVLMEERMVPRWFEVGEPK